jgi:LPXTG-motif cell wall-anchored protein
VNRVLGIARSRAGRVGLVAGLVATGVFALAAPASAHNAAVSGTTSCSDGTHVVHWTIGNDWPTPMTIASATAKIGNQSYAVTGYANPVSMAGTTATSVVPGGTSGTITLSLHVTWSDYQQSPTASVVLLSNCSTTTTQATTTTTYPVTTTTQHRCDCDTTTTQPVTTTTQHRCECETTTTLPETTTTVADSTTTTLPVTTTTDIHELGSTTIVTTTTKPKPHASTTVAAQGSTVPTTQPIASDAVLPHTGSGTTLPAIFGGLCLALGAALALRKRSAWSS